MHFFAVQFAEPNITTLNHERKEKMQNYIGCLCAFVVAIHAEIYLEDLDC